MTERDLKISTSKKKGQRRICWDCDYIIKLAENCKKNKREKICWDCSDYWSKTIPSHCSKGEKKDEKQEKEKKEKKKDKPKEEEKLIYVKGYTRKDGVKVKGHYKSPPKKK